jgi:hypothetical protein
MGRWGILGLLLEGLTLEDGLAAWAMLGLPVDDWKTWE